MDVILPDVYPRGAPWNLARRVMRSRFPPKVTSPLLAGFLLPERSGGGTPLNSLCLESLDAPLDALAYASPGYRLPRLFKDVHPTVTSVVPRLRTTLDRHDERAAAFRVPSRGH